MKRFDWSQWLIIAVAVAFVAMVGWFAGATYAIREMKAETEKQAAAAKEITFNGRPATGAVVELPRNFGYYNCPGHYFTDNAGDGPDTVSLGNFFGDRPDTRQLERVCAQQNPLKPVRKHSRKIDRVTFKNLPIGGVGLQVPSVSAEDANKCFVPDMANPNGPMRLGGCSMQFDAPSNFDGDPNLKWDNVASVVFENDRTWFCTATACVEIPAKVI